MTTWTATPQTSTPLTYAQWTSVGSPWPESVPWVPGSYVYKWDTNDQIGLIDPAGAYHWLSFDEWNAMGRPWPNVHRDQGFAKLTRTPDIARMTSLGSGQGYRIDYGTWASENWPTPISVTRFPGDAFYRNRGSDTIWYSGPTMNRPVTLDEWIAAGSPNPEVRTSRIPGEGDGILTIAVYPDTQQEVRRTSRFLDRTNWLVANRDALDLRFVNHTGDVVNWDTEDHAQYEVASAAMAPLDQAGIPYSMSIGNHDSMATGEGGSARDSKLTREYQRTTTTFNSYFTADRFGAVRGAYEPGKVDNVYSTFTAEGHEWLILNLELWPRLGVVDWANQVVASHPHHNVIVSTHSFLESDGRIWNDCAPTRCSYGDASPQYLFDNLFSQHSNIKVVLSGHAGWALTRTAQTSSGTKAFYLTTIHSNSTNPLRLLTIDVNADTIHTEVFGVNDGYDFGDRNTLGGFDFVE
ncbi:metallophosphoesterase [Miniimonas sp. S16]|uniref:metallophosphoesterase n=1 Tax=Miniimonas sp. S16 TaxID=2171623 RepID=UPI00131F13C8|nr:metallophosphoesterase [Miniimonas sp. S16]